MQSKERIINMRLGSEDRNGEEIYRKKRERERETYLERKRDMLGKKEEADLFSLQQREKNGSGLRRRPSLIYRTRTKIQNSCTSSFIRSTSYFGLPLYAR